MTRRELLALRAELDAAARVHSDHRRSHHCRESTCDTARGLASRVTGLQLRWGTQRFLAQPEEDGWTLHR